MAEGQITFGERIKLTNSVSRMQKAKVVDMDGDGDFDVFAVADDAFMANWWKNDGSGNFTRHTWGAVDGTFDRIFGISDWDGDGRQDLWIQEIYENSNLDSRYNINVAIGQPDGSFGTPFTVITPLLGGRSGIEPILADLDGNGQSDILGEGEVFLRQADGTFAQPVPLPSNASWYYEREVTLYDYDADGDQDMFLQNGRSYFENLGGGVFDAQQVLISPDADHRLTGIAFLEPRTPGGGSLLLVSSSHFETNQDKVTAYRRLQDGSLSLVEELLPAGARWR